jgi:hypothetical protein
MPIEYFLGVISLVCGGGIASVVAASAAYVFSKRFRLAKAVLAATITLLVIVVGLPVLLGFLNNVKRGVLTEFEAADLVGTWKAAYEDIGFHHVSGVEVLTLRADGTYQQTYKDGKGYVYTSPWYKWRLENGRVIHLEHGRFYLHGIAWAESFENSGTNIDFDGITLNGTEIVLYAWRDSSALGGVILEHLPVGDGDSPDIVQFHRVSTPVPKSTGTP